MANGTTPMTPPPDVTAAVPDVARTTKERVLGGIGGVLSAGVGDDPASSPLQKEMSRQHDIRLATARRHYENATTYGGILGTGEIDPQTDQPTGTDPNTGKPLTPEQRKQYQAMLDGAWGDYEKAAGVSKEAKAAIQQHKGLLDLLVTKGHKALEAVMGAHKQLTGGAQGASGATGATLGMSPPPAAGAPASGPAGATATPSSATGATGAIPPPPAPPAYNPQSAAQAPQLRQGLEENHAIAGQGKLQQAQFEQRKKQADDIGLTGLDRQEFIATGKMPTIPRLSTGTYTDLATGKSFTGAPDPTTGKILDVDTQAIVPGAIKETAGMQAAPSVKTVNGVPFSVVRNGKEITPDSPDFTSADKRLLDNAKEAYRQGNLDKMKLNQDRMNSYINARAKTQQYGVINKETGEPEMVNALTINANPGKYGPGALTQQLKNRAGVFDEIDATKDQFNSALGKLSDQDFEALPRVQIALALKDRDPRSALSTFLGSQVGTTLSPAQVDYVTGLMTMEESAMSLRSIAGMGQGSDSLRNAITRMLPGPETPSKTYAKRQMDLFKVELDALRKAVPQSDKLGMGDKKIPPPPSTSNLSRPSANVVVEQ